jgi:hypothetical protein
MHKKTKRMKHNQQINLQRKKVGMITKFHRGKTY